MRRDTLFFGVALLLAASAIFPVGASARPGVAKVKYCTRHKHPRGCVRVPKKAKRPSKRSQQGSGSLTPPDLENGGGLGGGPGDQNLDDAAVGWALSQRRIDKWAWYCERFVEEAYGMRKQFKTAKRAASRIKPLHHSPVTTAPRGALVYFRGDAANRGFGHVGLSLGGGRMISALAKVTITDVTRSRYWRSLYIGWASPPKNWRGRIPLPPGPTLDDPDITIHLSAPTVLVLTGAVRLAAAAPRASGVKFFAYYAADPHQPANQAWYSIGRGTRSSGRWVIDWDTTVVPNQDKVNVAAVALGDDGKEAAARDYRLFKVTNLDALPEGALLSVRRLSESWGYVVGWARDADDLDEAVAVTVLSDGQPAPRKIADVVMGNLGAHGFSFPIAIDDAPRTVCLRVSDIGPGAGSDVDIPGCRHVPRYADLNDDGRVDISDLSILLSDYGKPTSENGGRSDINGDGKVDITDQSILLAHYGDGVPPPPSATETAPASDQPVLDRQVDQPRALRVLRQVVDAERLEERTQVALHGLLRQVDGRADLLVGRGGHAALRGVEERIAEGLQDALLGRRHMNLEPVLKA